MAKLLDGKIALIMGVANQHSIATGIAEVLDELGAKLAFSYLPDKSGKMESRVNKALSNVDKHYISSCDVKDDKSIDQFFAGLAKVCPKIDYLVHSIAHAPLADIKCPVLNVSRSGFLQALDVSVYSFIACARKAAELMITKEDSETNESETNENDNEKNENNKTTLNHSKNSSSGSGSIVTLSYYGAQKVIPGYNVMGVAKSALEGAVRYLSFDLGKHAIRVNAVSAGPIKTLAASALGVSKLIKSYEAISPVDYEVSAKTVGQTVAYLLSDMSLATTGEILHVDAGYHAMGSILP